ncbi:GNAT family N-acetyltransferase [Flavobacterium facile]|uniref:GNAT family N-acetyltransferase n=1 Tax=Flavobacterium facile TaxID=2893174 RepID=UPI002E77BBF1|nr:GNAT family N-acetyltransferase [Flavobacterium sp. T-12]
MIFETERLLIRHLEERDSEAMFEIYSDKEAMKYRANQPFENISEAIEMIQQSKNDYKLGLKFRLAIEKKDSNELIGTILYFSEDINSEICTIGYSLGKNHWKQGFAFEVLNGFIPFLKTKEFKKLEAKVFKMNVDSIKLLNKLDFILNEDTNDEKLFTFEKIIIN